MFQKKSNLLMFSALFVLSIALFFITESIDSEILRLIRLEEWYGFIALTLLFLVVIAKPLYNVFPSLKSKNIHYESIESLTVSALYFVLLHSSINFFGLLQGFNGLAFLSSTYQVGLLLGFFVLLVLAIASSLSFKWIARKVALKPSIIYRVAYIIVLSLAVHVLLIGSYFHELVNPTAVISIIFFLILAFLYAISARNNLREKYPTIPSRVLTAMLCIAVIAILYGLYQIHGIMLGSHIHEGH